MEETSIAWVSGIISGLASGIITGIIANIIFRYNSNKRKPKILLCENIIKQFLSNDEPVLRIKVVNQGKHPISDIKLILYGVNYLDTEKKLKDISRLSDYFIDFLDAKKGKNDDITDHIYQPALKNRKENIHNELEKYEGLLLLIKATDTYYSSILTEYKQFDKEDIKDYNWNFIPGDNYGCAKNQRVKRPNYKEVANKFKKHELPKACPLVERTTN